MAIWLTKDSRVIVQGVTGSEGSKHTRRMLRAGTNIVGGTNPRKAGQQVDFDGTLVPVFGGVAEAMKETGADVSVIFVPPAFSTAVGIGGDPVIGTTHIDALAAFQDDPETDAIVMIGEIGGDAEERAAEFIKANVTKPVVGYIAGFTAPAGKTMGHAGAIISGSSGTADAKKVALEAAGVRVGKTPSETARLMREVIHSL